MQTNRYILTHRHIGKQRIILKQITHLPLLRRKIHPRRRIIQHTAVQHDASFIRLFDARDALERHALAAARCAQQPQNAAVLLESTFQHKAAQPLFDVHMKAHDFTAFFCRSSSRLTVSSTTALIAILTITHIIAPCSSFVRQS